jgi:RHS repeat-associated protein
MYVFGGSVDSPVAIIRSNFVGSWVDYTSSWDSAWVFRPRTILPLYDWRGSQVTAYFAENGLASWSEYDSTNTIYRVMAVPVGSAELAFGGLQPTTSSYFGTLLGGKRDDAGTFYRRNRNYDPITGRFTQEDPMGLMGGVNAYAYAGGDPINYRDPYGLQSALINGGGPGYLGEDCGDGTIRDSCDDQSGSEVPQGGGLTQGGSSSSGPAPNHGGVCVARWGNLGLAAVTTGLAGAQAARFLNSGWKFQTVARKAVAKIFAGEAFKKAASQGPQATLDWLGALVASVGTDQVGSGGGSALNSLLFWLGDNIPVANIALAIYGIYQDHCY